jgi:hypothetical protein
MPKRAVALQILGYSTISILRELFEQEPSIHFKDLEELSEALKAYENHVEKDFRSQRQ